MSPYRDLETYKISCGLALEVHQMNMLPKYELYEHGSQFQRFSKSLKDNIAEAYGRKGIKKNLLDF